MPASVAISRTEQTLNDPIDDAAIALVFPNGATFTDATMTGIVEQILPGHDALDVEEALCARFDCLTELAAHVQALSMQDVDITVLTEDALTVALTDKNDPVELAGPWVEQFPLIVVATLFEPYTDRPLPAGDLVVALDPLTERTFLDAFTSLGLATLMVRG